MTMRSAFAMTFMLSTLCSTVVLAQTPSPVHWDGAVHVTAVGTNQNGLQKTGGFDSTPDAGAYSQETIAGTGYVEFTAPATTAEIYVGLTTGSGVGTDAAFPWSIHLSSVGIAEVRENGAYRGEWAYAANDVFRIAVGNGSVIYTRNGGSAITRPSGPASPVRVDTSLLSFNGSVTNVVVAGAAPPPPSGPQPIIWDEKTHVDAIGAQSNGLRKTSGGNGTPDAGAYSRQTIESGDGYLEFKASNGTTDALIGFTDGDGSGTLGNFPWSIHLSTVGVAEVRENGAYRGEWTYVPNDTFRISIVSGQVIYTRNGGNPIISGALVTSATYPLKVDTVITTLQGEFTEGMISTADDGGNETATFLKVLTWNVHKGRATDGVTDSVVDGTIAAAIAAAGADVALLSAVETESEANQIASQLPPPPTGGWAVHWAKSTTSNEGQAIISRYQFVAGSKSSYQIASCANQTEDQVVVKAAIQVGTTLVNLFAVDQQHDDPGTDRSLVRRCQAEKFIQHLAPLAKPQIVGGDFNSSGDAGLSTWTSASYLDGWTAAAQRSGYPKNGAARGNDAMDSAFGRTKRSALDHILTLANPPLTHTAAQVWHRPNAGTFCGSVAASSRLGAFCSGDCSTCEYVDDQAVRPSDHIPLTVIIRIQ